MEGNSDVLGEADEAAVSSIGFTVAGKASLRKS